MESRKNFDAYGEEIQKVVWCINKFFVNVLLITNEKDPVLLQGLNEYGSPVVWEQCLLYGR